MPRQRCPQHSGSYNVTVVDTHSDSLKWMENNVHGCTQTQANASILSDPLVPRNLHSTSCCSERSGAASSDIRRPPATGVIQRPYWPLQGPEGAGSGHFCSAVPSQPSHCQSLQISRGTLSRSHRQSIPSNAHRACHLFCFEFPAACTPVCSSLTIMALDACRGCRRDQQSKGARQGRKDSLHPTGEEHSLSHIHMHTHMHLSQEIASVPYHSHECLSRKGAVVDRRL